MITVLLPVFNAEKFLASAIESILKQSFADFELLIFNDGSTDASENIILSYHDQRIFYIKNAHNKGLIATLNSGIDMARGMYIARMDADDISLPDRFLKQKNFLDSEKNIAMVACTVTVIDENGETIGPWELDRKTILPKQIKRTMILENCIAHPTVMGKTSVFKKFKYNKAQIHIEDYDLWLRLLNHKVAIAKIPDQLLLYRTHRASVTGKNLRVGNPFFKISRMKGKFLITELKKKIFTVFMLGIAVSMIADLLHGTGKEIKKVVRK